MSYQTFANPKGDYQSNQPSAAPTYRATPQEFLPPPKGEEGKFTEKKVNKGVGKFHGNHFRGYFSYISNPTQNQILAANKHFFENFCSIFSVSNIAKASTGKYKFNSKNTVEFQLGGTLNNLIKYSGYLFIPYPVKIPYPNLDALIGIIHSDWVSIERETNNLSCFASTLKREWIEKKELDLFSNITTIASTLNIVDRVRANELIKNIIEANQHHFLAGRRSWAIGYDNLVNLWYVESVAYEKSSVCEFSLIDKYGNLRQTVIELWINQINNYFSIIKNTSGIVATISGIPAKVNGKVIDGFSDYNYSRNVLFKVAEEKIDTNLLNAPWFSKCLQRHTGLTKNL